MNKFKETLTALCLALRYSFGFCWRNAKKETIGRIVIAILMSATIYLTVYFTGTTINAVQAFMKKNHNISLLEIMQSGLFWPVVSLLGILILGTAVSQFAWFFRSRWNHILRFANTRELNDHRATLDVACFRSQKYDDLMKRIQELPMSWQTRITFSNEMFSLFTSLVSFALFGSSLVLYKPIYALVLVLSSLPMVVVEFECTSMWWNLFQELVPHNKKRSVLEKPYHNSTTFVQALMFNQMPLLREKIDCNSDYVINAYQNIRVITLNKSLLTRLIAAFGLCGVLCHMLWVTITSAGEVGTLTVVLAAARTFQRNIDEIVSLVAEQWNSARGVLLIEQEFFGLKSVIKTESPIIPNFGTAPPVIRFHNVSFAYPDTDTLVLRNVSFTIKAGTKVAIVGKSGNGKSTVQALLMRHYDPTSGAIYAGGFDLRRIEPKEWYNTASALMQEYSVLERLVVEEVASSRLEREIDFEAVADSCRFANFEEVVDGNVERYNTQIGVEFGGTDFSGGEKQRLALARVHYRGTPIIILDEPDAKLDPESAKKVIDNIFSLKGVTVILITHHIAHAERCDKVIVMGKGEVAEQGTHSSLISAGGVYSAMCAENRKRLGQQLD